MAQESTKQQAHDLIDRMAPGQISAVVGLLEIMLDPLTRTLANAPYDDEPSEEDKDRSPEPGRLIPHGEVLASFGLSLEDFERLGKTPLPPDPTIRADQDV